MRIAVQAEAFDLAAETAALYLNNPRVGAVACFLGLVRDINDGDGIASLTLEHYPGMTEKVLTRIVQAAHARWNLLDTTLIHRIGRLNPTDPIVLVAVASAHRGDALAACAYIMDFLKTEAPFWKKESTPGGERWVDARSADSHAAGRWST